MLTALSPSTENRIGALIEAVHAFTGEATTCVGFIERAVNEKIGALGAVPVAEEMRALDMESLNRAVMSLIGVRNSMIYKDNESEEG